MIKVMNILKVSMLMPTLSLMASTGFAIYAMNSVVSSVANAPASSSSQVGSQTATGTVQAGVMHYGEVGANNIRMGNTHWGNMAIATTSFLTANALRESIANVEKQGPVMTLTGGSIGEAIGTLKSMGNLNLASEKLLKTLASNFNDLQISNLKAVNGQVISFEGVGKGYRISYDGRSLTYKTDAGSTIDIGIGEGGKLTVAQDNIGGITLAKMQEVAKIAQAAQEWAETMKAARGITDSHERAKVVSQGIQKLHEAGILDQTQTQKLLRAVEYMPSAEIGRGDKDTETKGEKREKYVGGEGYFKVEGYKQVEGGVGGVVPSFRFGAKATLGGAFTTGRRNTELEAQQNEKSNWQNTTLKVNFYDTGVGPNEREYYFNTKFTRDSTTRYSKTETSTRDSVLEYVNREVSNAISSKFSQTLQSVDKSSLGANYQVLSDNVAAIQALNKYGNNLENLGDVLKYAGALSRQTREELYNAIGNISQNLSPQSIVNDVNQKVPEDTKKNVENAINNQEKLKQDTHPKPKPPKKK